MALSVGLDSAVNALRAHQLAVDVASHNIANAQTPGYSRQQVRLEPNVMRGSGWNVGLQAGSGVTATSIRRVRDAFMDYQARQALSNQSQYNTFAASIAQAESAFNEPSDTGIAAQLGAFFSSWQDLVNDPGSSAARTALVNTATTLTSGIRAAASALGELRKNLDGGVLGVTNQINADAQEIARLNQQITQAEAGGETVNDLRDQRDNLLDDLAKLGQISYSEQPNHSVTVYLGNHELVNQSDTFQLSAVADLANAGMTKVVFAGDGQEVAVNSGRLRGLIDARDTEIPAVQAKLNAIASSLITQVNAIHQAGYGLDGSYNNAFFTGTTATDIQVNSTIANNPQKIAAASVAGAAGNADNAAAIAALQTSSTMLDTSGSFLVGDAVGAHATVSGINVSKALPGTYVISDDGAGNVTLTLGAQSQTVAVSPMGPNAVQTLNFDQLGIVFSLVSDGIGDTAANIGAGLTATSPLKVLGGSGGTLTIGQSYNNMVTVLGADVARAGDFATTNDLLAQQVDSQRQASSGVNIDEETASMAMSQKAYQAAARVITVIDAMLDTLINRMGV